MRMYCSNAHVRLQAIEYLNISRLVIDFATSPVWTGNNFFAKKTTMFCLAQTAIYTYNAIFYEAGPSTKDTTHLRRSGGVVGAKVNFDGSTPVASKKEHFLAHANNKRKVCEHAFSAARGRWLSCSAGSR